MCSSETAVPIATLTHRELPTRHGRTQARKGRLSVEANSVPTVAIDPLGFRYIDYHIRGDADIATYGVRPSKQWRPRKWRPDTPESFHKAMPKKLSPNYTHRFKQPFSPSHFYVNALMLANYKTDKLDRKALYSLVDALFERFLEYSVVEDGARFVVYTFDRTYGGVDVAAPWTSAYASGAVLVGLTKWIERFGEQRFHDAAEEILLGMARLRPPSGLWVSFVDDDQFLWFEEMPLPSEPQPRILNGHIRALGGLYHYHRATGSELAGRLLRGGVTTVRFNAERYRVPGEVNRYNLRSPDLKDYGPDRTVSQQRELFAMTGDPFFLEMSELFAADNAAAGFVAGTKRTWAEPDDAAES